MPTPTELDPARMEEIRRLLAGHQPAYELLAVEPELRPAPPVPPGADSRDQPPVSVSSPSLKTLQDHYRNLGFDAPAPQLPDPGRERPDEERRRLNPDTIPIRCRVRRIGAGSDAPELTVIVSISNGTVTEAPVE